MEWMVEHGAEVLNRYHVGKDGRTPYERLRGKRYKGEAIEFGRTVFHRHAGKVQGGSMQSRWSEGVWLGRRVVSDEHIIVMKNGEVVQCRAVMMKPEAESWDADAVLKVKATPWTMRGRKKEDEDESEHETTITRGVATMPSAEEQDVEDVKTNPVVPQELKVTPYLLRQYGYTKGCPKCDAMKKGDTRLAHRSHLPRCRDRIKAAMMEDEGDREKVVAVEQRINEYLEARVADQEQEDEQMRKKRRTTFTGENLETSAGSSGSNEGATSSMSTSAGQGGEDKTCTSTSMDECQERKRGRIAEEDEEERERPTGYQATDDDARAKDGEGDVVMQLGRRRKEFQPEDMEGLQHMKEVKFDVVEAFSPPRITLRARDRGMQGGWALDWMVKDPITGVSWDLRQESTQRKAMSMLRRDKPSLLVCSPPCTLFSLLQQLTGDPKLRDPEGYKDAVALVDFAVKMCLEQRRAGRFFLFEHPLSASSWKLASLSGLMKMAGVTQTTIHQCAYGLKSCDKEGEGLVLKPTRFLINSSGIAGKLQRKCTGGHRHVHLVGGRA